MSADSRRKGGAQLRRFFNLSALRWLSLFTHQPVCRHLWHPRGHRKHQELQAMFSLKDREEPSDEKCSTLNINM